MWASEANISILMWTETGGDPSVFQKSSTGFKNVFQRATLLHLAGRLWTSQCLLQSLILWFYGALCTFIIHQKFIGYNLWVSLELWCHKLQTCLRLWIGLNQVFYNEFFMYELFRRTSTKVRKNFREVCIDESINHYGRHRGISHGDAPRAITRGGFRLLCIHVTSSINISIRYLFPLFQLTVFRLHNTRNIWLEDRI